MNGENLHLFDLCLCRHALDNICCYLDNTGFAAYAEEHLHPAVWEYVQTLDADDGPPARLLRDDDFDALVEVFQGGFDRLWVAYEPLYRRSVDCVREIRVALAGAYAEEWASASVRAARKLQHDRTRLSDGIRAVQAWVEEARRLLRAMAVPHFLPHPEGGSPTPACPNPPQPPSPPAASPARQDETHDGLRAMIAEIQEAQREVRDLLISQRTVRDFYTTAEVATTLGKAEFTVREWCRRGRVRAQKQGSGRGKHQAWVISHGEFQRLEREGLLPADQPD
jgi:DNA-directed RNA polymerase specialized sigma24 family protein